MKLDYNILWYEDQEEWINSFRADLEDELAERGFRLKTDIRPSGDNPNSLIVDPKVDLLLVDFNLGHKSGAEIIEHFRKNQVYTEVVFYSAQAPGELRRAIVEMGGVDGVYCLGRGRGSDFLETLLKIIHTTIKKVEDINNIRGLVMAGVGDCDLHIQETILSRYEQLDENGKTDVSEYVKRKIESAIESQTTSLSRLLEEGDFNSFMDTRICPSGTLVKILMGITKPYRKDEHVKPFRDKLANYDSEVLKPRRELAHCREGEKDGKVFLITHEGHKEYSETDFAKIRKDLNDHTGNLMGIKALVGNKKLNI